jgi:hypothetical protein
MVDEPAEGDVTMWEEDPAWIRSEKKYRRYPKYYELVNEDQDVRHS